MVWKARQARAAAGRRPMDWVVLRNRMSTLDARNKRRVATALEELARRIGFRLVPGFSERVVFRELFLSGLTLLDLRETDPAGDDHVERRRPPGGARPRARPRPAGRGGGGLTGPGGREPAIGQLQ